MGPKHQPLQEPVIAPGIQAFMENKSWLERLARRLVQDQSQADEVVQKVWIAAWKFNPRKNGDPRPWLSVVAKRAAKKMGCSERIKAWHEKNASHPHVLIPAPPSLEREETQKSMAGYIQDLEEPYRSTVIQHFFEDLTLEEIAKRRAVPSSTVRTWLRRGLERLRVRLDSQYGDPANWAVVLLPICMLGEGLKKAGGKAGAGFWKAKLPGVKAFFGAAALFLFASPLIYLLTLAAWGKPASASQSGSSYYAVVGAKPDAAPAQPAAQTSNPTPNPFDGKPRIMGNRYKMAGPLPGWNLKPPAGMGLTTRVNNYPTPPKKD